VLSKDDVRSALFPGAAKDYSEEQNDLAMVAILAAADYLRGKPDGPRFILFDGRTFSRRSQIESVIAAAESGGSQWRILHLVCPDAEAERRLAGSAPTHPAADRNFRLYLALKQRFEVIQRPHRVIDTGQPVDDCVRMALTYLGISSRTME
jgi:predicted kinase